MAAPADSGRNSTIRLAIIRSLIDKQQQVIGVLENRLQESILGGTDVSTVDGPGSLLEDKTTAGLLYEVAKIYGETEGQFIDSDGDGDIDGDDVDSNGDPSTSTPLNPGPPDANGDTPPLNANNFIGLSRAMLKGLVDFDPALIGSDDGTISGSVTLEQDALRQMLYQARALLGELRVEEQHWNGEVNEEKQRRKELADFTKG